MQPLHPTFTNQQETLALAQAFLKVIREHIPYSDNLFIIYKNVNNTQLGLFNSHKYDQYRVNNGRDKLLSSSKIEKMLKVQAARCSDLIHIYQYVFTNSKDFIAKDMKLLIIDFEEDHEAAILTKGETPKKKSWKSLEELCEVLDKDSVILDPWIFIATSINNFASYKEQANNYYVYNIIESPITIQKKVIKSENSKINNFKINALKNEIKNEYLANLKSPTLQFTYMNKLAYVQNIILNDRQRKMTEMIIHLLLKIQKKSSISLFSKSAKAMKLQILIDYCNLKITLDNAETQQILHSAILIAATQDSVINYNITITDNEVKFTKNSTGKALIKSLEYKYNGLCFFLQNIMDTSFNNPADNYDKLLKVCKNYLWADGHLDQKTKDSAIQYDSECKQFSADLQTLQTIFYNGATIKFKQVIDACNRQNQTI